MARRKGVPPGQRGFGFGEETIEREDEDLPSVPYVRGSDTSYAAARSIAPELPRLEGVVLDCIRKSGEHGRTDDEVETITKLSHQCASARRRGLVLKDRVVDSGRRRVTRSGRKATVWVVVKKRLNHGS